MRLRLLTPLVVTKDDKGKPVTVSGLKLVTPQTLATMQAETLAYGVPVYYAVYPQPDPDKFLPLVEPKERS